MSRLGIRWVVLYFLSILVPAALLAFLSVRSLRDVRDSVRQELRSKTVLVQDAFDRFVDSRAQLLSAYSEEAQWTRACTRVFLRLRKSSPLIPRVHCVILRCSPCTCRSAERPLPLRWKRPQSENSATKTGGRRAALPPSL